MRNQLAAFEKNLAIAILVCILFLLAAAQGFADGNLPCANKRIVSGFAEDVGTQKKESVYINTVPKGKIFILTDIVADRAYGTFSFNISGKISLSINIKEYSIDESPSWHFYSGIPFKADEKVIVNKLDGRGNVFISGYLIDE
jgi:hypothetical protein